MSRRLRRAHVSQLIAVVLAMSWLPYASMRCTDSQMKHGGCPMAATARASQTPSSLPPCCQRVRQCEVRATLAGAPEVAPAVLPVIPAALVDGWHPSPQPLPLTVFDATEGPPLYLRHAALLI